MEVEKKDFKNDRIEVEVNQIEIYLFFRTALLIILFIVIGFVGFNFILYLIDIIY